MKYTAILAFIGAALAAPAPQGVTDAIAPSDGPPDGCSPDASTFNIQVVNVSSSAKLKRQQSGILTLTLSGGALKDQAGRTGYIAANDQFQFDSPPQTGAIYTSGFSLCSNGSLAIGGTTIWWQCLSGDFYNIYSEKQGDQCNEIYIEAINSQGGGPAPAAPATQATDGQPAVTSAAAVSQKSDGQPNAVTQIGDGQPQAPGACVPVTQISDGQPQAGHPVTQISDGQPQAPTCAPVTQISDGQPQAPKGPTVSQISDGQPQAPKGAPVSQISDGQPQAPTGAPVSQISDGQPQAPTGAPVSQISDGQPQAPVSQISDGQPQAPVSQISDGQPQAPVSQISDGQPQAPVSQISDGQPQAPTGAPVSQISDGQPQATAPAAYTGAASHNGPAGYLVAGLVGAAALL